jgi:uncharacterized protein YxjI
MQEVNSVNALEELSSVNQLVVRQKKEWGEIFTGFETKNRYVVQDTDGADMFYAAEIGGSMLLRFFLKAMRPFEVAIMSPSGSTVIRVKRPFKFYFHKAEICDGQGNHLGTIQKRFSLLRRCYSVLDANEQEVCELFGPILHPWTFNIVKEGQNQGKITKKWSGLLKESFSDADNFGIEFPAGAPPSLKGLLLGAVFLIDFVHFENKGNN